MNTRRSILFTALLLLFQFTFAQDEVIIINEENDAGQTSSTIIIGDDGSDPIPYEKKMHISMGFTAGANLSNISSSEDLLDPEFSTKVGFNAGIFANFRFLKRNPTGRAEEGLFAFEPGIKYSMYGAKSDNGNISIGYLTIPIMLQYYPLANLYIEAGPELAFMLTSSPDNFAFKRTSVNLSDLKANDCFITFGAGYLIKGFGIGARYTMGTSEYAKNLPWKNSAIQINLSYRFGLN